MRATTGRLKRLEKGILAAAIPEGALVLRLHPDGSGTDETSGQTYSIEEIAERERSGSGWLVHISEQNHQDPEVNQ